MATHYKEAGVDIQAGDQLVDWLKESDRSHQSPALKKLSQNMISGIGGFAALFRFPKENYKKPVLVSCTDGVGTKVKLASHFSNYSTVGQDLVAMCVNDLITCGAQPFFFLDYFATGKLELKIAQQFLTSVRKACESSSCLLIGGETAEMPGVYQKEDFDCAGFAVGVVEEDDILGAPRVKAGDRLLGVNSSGFHSNGYSLLRRVFEADLEKWKDVLLTPTHLYVDLMNQALKLGGLSAAAHITGGGVHNIPRVLPDHLTVTLPKWEWTEPFREVQRRTQMSHLSMLEALNCGIGFVLVVNPASFNAHKASVEKLGFTAFDLGTLNEKSKTSDPTLNLSLWEKS